MTLTNNDTGMMHILAELDRCANVLGQQAIADSIKRLQGSKPKRKAPIVANKTPGKWKVRRLVDDIPEYWETETDPEPLVYVGSREPHYKLLVSRCDTTAPIDAKVWTGYQWGYLWRESVVEAAKWDYQQGARP